MIFAMRKRVLVYSVTAAVVLLAGSYVINGWLTHSLNRDDVVFLFILFAFWPWITANITTNSHDRRTDRRRHQGLCTQCAYDLTGNESGFCPECGLPITSELSASESTEAQSTREIMD